MTLDRLYKPLVRSPFFSSSTPCLPLSHTRHYSNGSITSYSRPFLLLCSYGTSDLCTLNNWFLRWFGINWTWLSGISSSSNMVKSLFLECWGSWNESTKVRNLWIYGKRLSCWLSLHVRAARYTLLFLGFSVVLNCFIFVLKQKLAS